MTAPSLTRRLIWTLTVGAVLLWLAMVGLAVTSLNGRLNDAFDAGLRETAERLLPLALDGLGELKDADNDVDHQIPLYDETGGEYLIYQVRLKSGAIVLRSHDSPPFPLPVALQNGFADSPPWRVFTLSSAAGDVFIQLAEPLDHRLESLRGSIIALVLPIAIFVPLAVLGIAFAVGRGLRPVSSFAAKIGARKTDNLAPIGEAGLPAELLPIAGAVDELILRVRAALEAERSFSANSAHELRTPIAGSLAQTQRLIAELEGNPAQARARQIEQALHKLTALAEKLLQLSRAEAGISRTGTSIDLTAAVRLVVEDVQRGLTDPQRVRLSITAPPLGKIDIDAFGIALRNLIDNALRHGAADVPVEVSAEAGCVRVVNGGPVIAAAQMAGLRQRFVRGNTPAGGSGLGLAIVDTIMQQAGGRLDLTSPAPGRADGFAATLVFDA